MVVNDVLERVKQEAATTYMTVLPQHLPYRGSLLLSHNCQMPLPFRVFIILTQPYS